nr:MAG TPA: hypothetical protein [Caudoviricetes sp.]
MGYASSRVIAYITHYQNTARLLHIGIACMGFLAS